MVTANSPVAQAVYGVTMCGWVNPTAFNGTVDTVTAFSRDSATNSRIGLAYLNTGAVRGVGRCGDGDSLRLLSGTAGLVQTGIWQHIAASLDYTNKLIRVYYNGTLDATSAPVVWADAPSANTASATGSIGGGHRTDGIYETVKAYIDDVRIYSRVLSDAELATIYACRGTDGIVQSLGHRYLLNELNSGAAVSTTANSVKDCGPLNYSAAADATGASFNYDQSILKFRRRSF
jgi:hypothetical protein